MKLLDLIFLSHRHQIASVQLCSTNYFKLLQQNIPQATNKVFSPSFMVYDYRGCEAIHGHHIIAKVHGKKPRIHVRVPRSQEIQDSTTTPLSLSNVKTDGSVIADKATWQSQSRSDVD